MTNLQGASREIGQRERLSGEGYMYCLYWIRTEAHTDPHSEGYIGISKNLKERIRAHKKNKRKTRFTSAVKKYGWEALTFQVLATNLSQEDALFLEKLYRPSCRIAWNGIAGGDLGVKPEWYCIAENSDKHREATSAATKLAIAEKDTHEARSYRAKVSWLKTREKRVLAVTGENNPRAKLKEVQVRQIKYDLIPSGLSDLEISLQFDVKPYVIYFIRKGKNWSHI